MGTAVLDAARAGEWPVPAEWHFVQQVMLCHERILCAKAQQQLLLLIKAAYGTCGGRGTMEAELQYRF